MRATLLLFACLSGTATAATLRPFGSVAGPVVCVSDLWDDAGEAASRALGPAPAPGERIVVDAPQLAAIARQFGVDWRPGSATERSILERPGMPLPHEAVEAALAASLAAAGAPDGSIEMPDFAPPLVAPESHPRIVVEQLQWEPAGSRFAASLAVTGRNMTTLRLRVSGRVVDMVDAVVSTRRLLAGDVLRAADVALARLPRERPARGRLERRGLGRRSVGPAQHRRRRAGAGGRAGTAIRGGQGGHGRHGDQRRRHRGQRQRPGAGRRCAR